jgi:transposase
MARHFALEIGDRSLRYELRQERIAQEAALEGFHVVRTSVRQEAMGAEQVVATYTSLSSVGPAFRSYRSVDLEVRPIHHRLEGRVRAHVLLSTLAYCVEWHMCERLAPILFDDHDPRDAERRRESSERCRCRRS